ncbi:MAG: hypothetical protein GY714_00200 [Desulfobacterales bacterium]|nr:hypothetical protein [Desulfobacterales bacterium]MCP4160015.1 hypothetical protein [Deltaproteobacteria bacterium]
MKTFEPQKMMGQLVEFQKNAFNNTYDAMLKIQEQSEKIVTVLTSGQLKTPKESQKYVDNWTMALKKQQAEFKTNVDSGFEKFKSLCEGGVEKTATKTQTPAKAKAKSAK